MLLPPQSDPKTLICFTHPCHGGTVLLTVLPRQCHQSDHHGEHVQGLMAASAFSVSRSELRCCLRQEEGAFLQEDTWLSRPWPASAAELGAIHCCGGHMLCCLVWGRSGHGHTRLHKHQRQEEPRGRGQGCLGCGCSAPRRPPTYLPRGCPAHTDFPKASPPLSDNQCCHLSSLPFLRNRLCNSDSVKVY